MSPTTAAAGPPGTGAAGTTARAGGRRHEGHDETFAGLLAALAVTPAVHEPGNREPAAENKGHRQEEPAGKTAEEPIVDAVRATLLPPGSPASAPEALPQRRDHGRSRPVEPAVVVQATAIQATASRGGNARAGAERKAPAPSATEPATPGTAGDVVDGGGGDPTHQAGQDAGRPSAPVHVPVASGRSSLARRPGTPDVTVLRPNDPRGAVSAPGVDTVPVPSEPPAGMSDPTPRSTTATPGSPSVAFVRRAALRPTRSAGRAQARHAIEQPATEGPETTTTNQAAPTPPPLPGPTALQGGGTGSTPPPRSPLQVLPTLDLGQASAVLARLSAAGPGSHVVAMDLNPPGLGTVLARVQVSDSQLVVVLSPKDATVAQALAQNLADLGHQLGLTAGHRTLTLRLVDPEAGPRERGGSGAHEHPGRGRGGTGWPEGPEPDGEPGADSSVPTTLNLRL